MSASVAVIGECMLELTHSNASSDGVALPMNMRYGGDTINTSIYLSRNGISVSYVTGLGDDIMSDWMLNEWAKEGIDCTHVTRMQHSTPGMYMVNVNEDGERSFLYWRKNSPASRAFDEPASAEAIFKSISSYQYLYLSGISLAILTGDARKRLLGLIEPYREKGGKIVFDGNYRPNMWSSAEEARQTYLDIYKITDIALPTFEDEALLFGYDSAQEAITAIQRLGVSELVLKMGAEGCFTLEDGDLHHIKTDAVIPVDTTAAGDSFNAGYLAARLKGQNCLSACGAGHKLAAKVIQHQGAIIPIEYS